LWAPHPESCRESEKTILSLRRPDVDCPRPLVTAFDIKLDYITFSQIVEVELLQARAVEKDFLTLRRPDEPKAAVTNDSLYCTLHQKPHSARRGGRSRQVKNNNGRPTKIPLLRFHVTLPTPQPKVKVKGRCAARSRAGRIIFNSKAEVLRAEGGSPPG
jgi:hypothetical protein